MVNLPFGWEPLSPEEHRQLWLSVAGNVASVIILALAWYAARKITRATPTL